MCNGQLKKIEFIIGLLIIESALIACIDKVDETYARCPCANDLICCRGFCMDTCDSQTDDNLPITDAGDAGGDSAIATQCGVFPGANISSHPERDDDFVLGIPWVGDVNGDRYEDMLIHIFTSGLSASGLIYGTNAGIEISTNFSIEQLVENADVLFLGVPPKYTNGNNPGIGVNDLNKDGYNDLMFGSPAFSDRHALPTVYIVYGGPNLKGRVDVRKKGISIRGKRGSNFGWDAAGGDLNSDGYNDLLIVDIGTETRLGNVSVFFGNGKQLKTGLSSNEADWTIYSLSGIRIMGIYKILWDVSIYRPDIVFSMMICDEERGEWVKKLQKFKEPFGIYSHLDPAYLEDWSEN